LRYPPPLEVGGRWAAIQYSVISGAIPRCPKVNAYVERYNIDKIWDRPLFAGKLVECLVFYNTTRPHRSLGLTI